MSATKKRTKMRSLRLNNICRICLLEQPALRNIFSSTFPAMFRSCTSIKVSEDDGLPKHLCSNCFRQICKFYAFRKRALRSRNVLNAYVREQPGAGTCPDALAQAVMDADIKERNIKEEQHDEKIELLMDGDAEGLGDCLEDDVPLSQIKSLLRIAAMPPLTPINSSAPIEAENDDKELRLPPLIITQPLATLDPLHLIRDDDDLSLPLACSTCHAHFTSVKALRDHRLHVCQPPSHLACTICHKTFAEKTKLVGHLRGHLVAKNYRCRMCDMRYATPSALRIHLRTHTGERPYQCHVCDRAFIRWSGLACHMRTHNSQAKPCICEVCGASIKLASNMERHKRLHAASLPFCCSYCGKTFGQRDNLETHVRTHHTNELPYLCSACGKRFVSRARLNRHMFTHRRRKAHVCVGCGETFASREAQTQHEPKCTRWRARTRTKIATKKHACNTCGKGFVRFSNLEKHRSVHVVTCGECTLSFATQALLDAHVQSEHVEPEVEGQRQTFAEVYVEYLQ